MQETLKQLCELYGPSGSEDAVRQAIREAVSDLASQTRVDALGNLIVRAKAGTPGGKRVMLAAHMDEIGLVVNHIDEKGFIRFGRVGGIRPIGLVGQRVRFASGQIGVVGIEPVESNNDVDLPKMYIDVGATSREEAEKIVHIGDTACLDRHFSLANGRAVCKAMDDRVGCTVQVAVLRALQQSPHDIYVVFTTQEEVGVRGATTSAYGVAPDLGVAVDITPTGDTPEARPMAVSLGKGPAVKVMDSGMLAHPGLKDLLIRTAEAHGIPYQREVLLWGSTDARAIQTTQAGIPAGTVSIPTRYAHSPSEMVDMQDVANAVRLLLALLEGPIDL